MARATSPALSENEVDISNSLFQGDISDIEPEENEENQQSIGRIIEDGNENSEDSEDDDAFIAATQAAANRKADSKTAKKAGAFQSMGLNAHLLKAVSKKGFTVPTPIQRKAIPLVLDGQDVVGMARTGSGKTAAFVIPMIEKLKAHSAKVGARAIVLSPTRELALQTLKVVKELGKGTDLRTILLVGGDSLEDQFSSMASNPDVVIATPGRFQHLKVEMGLDLSSVHYVVFDEADRLFEMGFATQLTEIMHSLPSSRQTLLFSATLPKSLVEFARAGLQDPKLVRLDAESKIAPGLQSAFFTVKRAEKEGALLHILQDVIKLPIGSQTQPKSQDNDKTNTKKRKRGSAASEAPSAQSTVIFASTKHHVEYLTSLLKAFGYATSFVYGSLDQVARKVQTQDFRTGVTNILVVTDVAARGLDIPVLANVINYDFPSQPKIFVHRVGRTARAGKTGWSYSLVTGQDMPYLLDLQLFLSRKLVIGRGQKEAGMFKDCIIVGNLQRDKVERCAEETTKTLDEDVDLMALRDVSGRSEKQYLRTRNSASAESVKRARQIAQSEHFDEVNMLFENAGQGNGEQQRLDMLARVSGFRPQETVFEIGKRGAVSEAASVVKKRRAAMDSKNKRKLDDQDDEERNFDQEQASFSKQDDMPAGMAQDSDDELVLTGPDLNMDEASDDELELTFANSSKTHNKRDGDWQDSEHFMAYMPSSLNLAEDRGYGVQSGTNTNFAQAAQGATMDLTNDETKAFGEQSKSRGMRWDKKSKKYVSRANDMDGSKGAKYITSESGQKIAASFRSGRFDAWRKANRIDRLPKVGELERKGSQYSAGNGGQQRRFKHKMEKAPKEADKYRDDYEKRKARVNEAREKRVGRFAEGKGKNELRGVDDVRKARKLQARRKEKNARPRRKT